jgi:hypothetical protein
MSFLSGTGGTNILNAINIGGQLLKGFSQLKQSNVEANVFEYNAKIKQQEADLIRQKSILDEQVQRERSRRTVASQQAQFAGSGVVSTVGSAADVLMQTSKNLEMDILINMFNASVDESNAINESRFQLQRAQSQRTAGRLEAGSTLLTALPLLGNFKFKSKQEKAPKSTSLNFDKVTSFA